MRTIYHVQEQRAVQTATLKKISSSQMYRWNLSTKLVLKKHVERFLIKEEVQQTDACVHPQVN